MKRLTFLNKITICVLTFLLTICGAFAAMFYSTDESITASAETIEYQDLLGIENRSWGANNDEYYYGGVTLEPFGYFNSADSVNGCWYLGNDALIAANNGVDILQYIYINNKSARDAIKENVNQGGTLVGSSGWLTNPAASPVYVETTNHSGIIIKILKAYAGDTYTITFKAGFSLIRSDGKTIYISNDIIYNCNGNVPTKVAQSTVTFQTENGNTVETKRVVNGQAIGELPALPEKSGYDVGFWTIDGAKIDENTIITMGKTAKPVYAVEYMDLWGLENRTSWASDNENVITFGAVTLEPFGYFITAGGDCWYQGNQNVITANNGVDIMKYIYINGECARDLLVDNISKQQSLSGTGSWLSNPAAWPIAVQTSGDIYIRLDKSRFGEDITITFKEGFSLIRNDGEIIYLSEDVSYTYKNGVLSRVQMYTLTFDGVAETKRLANGQTIGELPEIPKKSGCDGVWMIDDVEITSDTPYTYGADKTATLVYSKDITDTINLGDWGVPETESDIRYLLIRDNDVEIGTSYPNSYWNDHEDNKNSNFNVDIMDYILIDGESARSIIVKNQQGITNYKATDTFPLNVGGIYAPITLETVSSAIRLKVMVDFKTSWNLTFKAGFTIVNSEGVKLYVSEDVTYNVGATMNDINKGEYYILSFADGTSKEVLSNQPIGELPEVPLNANDSECEGVWAIDGVEITVDTLYTFGADKTAVALYSRDITKFLAMEDRSSWDVHDGEVYFGVLDTSEVNKVVNKENSTYYLNAITAGCWYVGNEDIISANNGVDIMEYIYVNGVSARTLLTENVNGDNLCNNCTCWLSNPAASPVYVDTTNDRGIMIKVLKAFVGDYFEISFKSGFSLINEDGVRVYLTDDITYKYIEANGTTTFVKGELTDDDLDMLNGHQITLINNGTNYLTKTTCRLTLPKLKSFEKDDMMQTFIGWTTDVGSWSDLYPAGYKFEPTEATTLYALWMGFAMQDGAAVRTSVGSSGIRFLTDIDSAEYKNYVAKGLISKIGTIVCPTDYLNSIQELTHENLGFNDEYYTDIELENWRKQDGDTWEYAAALVNIQEKQFARAMSARGYLLISYFDANNYREDKYIYTPYTIENNSRSIYDVALAAYDDEENPSYKTNGTILNYINNVVNLTWNAEDYSFERTKIVAGDYEITDIDLQDYTVTVKVSGNITSAVVNGARLANGSSPSNITLGNFIFSVSNFKLVEGGFQFVLGAASNLYDKESKETLYFESSDADLDFFLNDYFKRHSAYVENGENLKVNTTIGGVNSQEFFSHEWMSMSYYWYNSFEGYVNEKGENQDRIAGLRQFLSTVPVDDYGYVWSSNDRVRDAYSDISTGEQKMGWPFPNNDTVKTSHWEFNSSSESWSSNIGATASGGLYTKNVSNQSLNITFTSNSFNTLSGKKIYTKYAPLLEFEVRMDDATNVEDIYVWYTTNSSTSFSEDKKVSVNEKAFIKYDYNGQYEHVLYLPMYAESAWGESTSTYVKQLKIEIVLKSGKTISGNVGLNYVRPTLDTRMSNNNSILISSLRTDYDYTGDLTYLQNNITRARKAMNFLMQMYDSARGLKKESYLVGHGGNKEDLNWLGNATVDSIANSISQGYWDITYMPEYDFQSNMYFYKAVRDMAYLENILAENGITVDKNVATVKTATRNRTTGTSAYNYDLNSVANTVLANLRQTTENTKHTGFWDAADGRFVAGYASGENKWYDYGYVAWNLEAIYYGIATDEQAAAIMNWLESEDKSKLYKYTFAPISNTVTGDASMLNGEYEARGDKWVNCQFGGAIMYTSFYDLMARINTNGADDAFERLTAIKDWYKEVYDYYMANGSNPEDFYRYYYDSKKIQMQGTGTAGVVGLDDEFLESFLPVSAVAYGFFGIDSIDGKTLEIAPELPANLDYWKMENLAFNKVKYDLKIFNNAVQISNVRGDTAGLEFQIALDCVAGQTVYMNGVAVTPTKVENGKAYVKVAMGAVIVEIR